MRTFPGVIEWSVTEFARGNPVAYCSRMNEETLYSQLAGSIGIEAQLETKVATIKVNTKLSSTVRYLDGGGTVR